MGADPVRPRGRASRGQSSLAGGRFSGSKKSVKIDSYRGYRPGRTPLEREETEIEPGEEKGAYDTVNKLVEHIADEFDLPEEHLVLIHTRDDDGQPGRLMDNPYLRSVNPDDPNEVEIVPLIWSFTHKNHVHAMLDRAGLQYQLPPPETVFEVLERRSQKLVTVRVALPDQKANSQDCLTCGELMRRQDLRARGQDVEEQADISRLHTCYRGSGQGRFEIQDVVIEQRVTGADDEAGPIVWETVDEAEVKVEKLAYIRTWELQFPRRDVPTATRMAFKGTIQIRNVYQHYKEDFQDEDRADVRCNWVFTASGIPSPEVVLRTTGDIDPCAQVPQTPANPTSPRQAPQAPQTPKPQAHRRKRPSEKASPNKRAKGTEARVLQTPNPLQGKPPKEESTGRRSEKARAARPVRTERIEKQPTKSGNSPSEEPPNPQSPYSTVVTEGDTTNSGPPRFEVPLRPNLDAGPSSALVQHIAPGPQHEDDRQAGANPPRHVSGHPSQGTASASSHLEMHNKCRLCWTAPRSAVYIPCGHVWCCKGCIKSPANQMCSVCFMVVERVEEGCDGIDEQTGGAKVCVSCKEDVACMFVLPCKHLRLCAECFPKRAKGCPACGQIILGKAVRVNFEAQ